MPGTSFGFGSGAAWFTPQNDAYGNAIANPSPILLGTLQDIQVDFSRELKDLYGMNAIAVALAAGKLKITGKAKWAQVFMAPIASLFLGQPMTTSSVSNNLDVTGSVIPATPFIISPTPPNSGTWSADLGVRDIYNNPLTRVASAPTTGQYALTAAALGATASFATNVMTVTIAPTSGTFQVGQTITSAGVAPGTTITSLGTGSGGTGTYNLSTSPGTITAQATTGGVGYLFAAADVGKTVFISYQSTAISTTSKSGTFVNSVMGNVPFFRCDFYDGLQGNATSISLFQCGSSKFSLGTKLDDFLTQELDFQAIQNAAGQVISIGTSQ